MGDLEILEHQRRMALMKMQGDINRQEYRLHIMWAVAIGLGLLALVLSCL